MGHPVPIVAPKIEPPNLNKTTNEMMDTFVEYIEVKSSNVGPNILSDIPWIFGKEMKSLKADSETYHHQPRYTYQGYKR